MEKHQTRNFLRAILWRGQRVVNWLRNKLVYARDARELERSLFADINQLDKQAVKQTAEKLREFCAARGFDAVLTDDWETHTYRILLTQQWIQDIISGPATQCVDLGEESITTDFWRLKFPHTHWLTTNYDLRNQWLIESDSTDLILCTELIEHLSDHPNDKFNEGFYKLGTMSLLREAYRVLKPGGYLFLSTPNAASVLHLKLALQGDPPWFYIKHVREYTLNEVLELTKSIGFQTVRARDVHCMTVMAFSDYSSIFQLLLENGFNTGGRGDDLFVLVQKPA